MNRLELTKAVSRQREIPSQVCLCFGMTFGTNTLVRLGSNVTVSAQETALCALILGSAWGLKQMPSLAWGRGRIQDMLPASLSVAFTCKILFSHLETMSQLLYKCLHILCKHVCDMLCPRLLEQTAHIQTANTISHNDEGATPAGH
eukprot:6143647-Amphidinium_carterae.1